MPINFDIIGARVLADTLRNPATSPRVMLEARNAGIVAWKGSVAQVSQTGNTLRVRGYSETLPETLVADDVTVEYGKDSVRGGLVSGDFSIISAAPLPGRFIEFLFLVSSPTSQPSLTDAEYGKRAKTSAEEAADSADSARIAKESALRSEIIADDGATSAVNSAQTAQTKASDASASAAIASTKSGQATVDATAAADAKTRAKTSADSAAAALAGMVVAPPNSIASSNQVVSGGDPRLGLRGGVRVVGTTSWAGSSNGYALGARAIPFQDGEAHFLAKHDGLQPNNSPLFSGVAWAVHVTETGQMRVWDQALNSGVGGYLLDTAAGTWPANTWAWVGCSIAGGVFTLFLNGVIVGSGALGWTGSEAVTNYRLLSGVGRGTFDAYGSFSGIINNGVVFNRTLTADERAGVYRGETPENLTAPGYLFAPTNWVADFSAKNAVSSATSTGFTNEHTALDGNVSGLMPVWTARQTIVGQHMRVRCHVALNSGSAADLPGVCIYNGTFFVAPSPTTLAVGANDFTVEVKHRQFDRVLFNHHSGVWGNNSADVGYTISNIEITFLGILECFDADKVTLSGRWAGRFGLSLLPGSGLTPLAPVHAVTHAARCSASSVSVSSGAEASVTLAGVSASDSPILSDAQLGDGVEWTPDSLTPVGLAAKSVRVTAAGSVQLRYANTGGSSTSSGAATGTLIIFKR